MAKCYFAKHKLVWELLDGNLKNKIEIQWSDIVALKATYPEDGLGTLDVVVSHIYIFFSLFSFIKFMWEFSPCFQMFYAFDVLILLRSWRDSPFSLGK